jgi:hypothetical protein
MAATTVYIGVAEHLQEVNSTQTRADLLSGGCIQLKKI